jgi:hypothetical protein
LHDCATAQSFVWCAPDIHRKAHMQSRFWNLWNARVAAHTMWFEVDADQHAGDRAADMTNIS